MRNRHRPGQPALRADDQPKPGHAWTGHSAGSLAIVVAVVSAVVCFWQTRRMAAGYFLRRVGSGLHGDLPFVGSLAGGGVRIGRSVEYRSAKRLAGTGLACGRSVGLPGGHTGDLLQPAHNFIRRGNRAV